MELYYLGKNLTKIKALSPYNNLITFLSKLLPKKSAFYPSYTKSLTSPICNKKIEAE